MARNRQIKADFWSDEKIGRLSIPARLMFIGLWNFADDSGICRANPMYIKNQIFPYDNLTTKKTHDILTECSLHGLIRLIEYSNEKYLEIINFTKHQLINRPSKFRYIDDLESAHDILTDTSLTNVNVNVNVNGNGNGNGNVNGKELSPLQSLWNKICGTKLDKVIANSKDRQSKERLRLKEREYDLWDDVFVKILQSEFCCGKNDNGWQASYDWIMKNDTNALKVMEGKYNGKTTNSKRTPQGKTEELPGKYSNVGTEVDLDESD